MYSNQLQERVLQFAQTLPFQQTEEFFEILKQQDRETMEQVQNIIKLAFKSNDKNLPKMQ